MPTTPYLPGHEPAETSLDRVDTAYGVSFRHELTPLTSFTFTATRSNARFEFSPDRNTVSNSALIAVKFQPAALLSWRLFSGFDDFKPADSSLPGYQGFIGNLDLTYVLLGSTRFAVIGGRGVQYSFDFNQPVLRPVPHRRLRGPADLRSVRRPGEGRRSPRSAIAIGPVPP